MTSSPLQWQKQAPTRELAETMLNNLEKRYLGEGVYEYRLVVNTDNIIIESKLGD